MSESYDQSRILYQLQIDVKYLADFLKEYKGDLGNFEEELSNLQSRLNIIKVEHGAKIKNVEVDVERIASRIKSIESSTREINDNLKSNFFISFFSDLDIKKFIILITVLGSVISSPTIISDLTSQTDEVKLERLIEVLQEGAK